MICEKCNHKFFNRNTAVVQLCCINTLLTAAINYKLQPVFVCDIDIGAVK